MGSSLKDMKALPDPVQDDFGKWLLGNRGIAMRERTRKTTHPDQDDETTVTTVGPDDNIFAVLGRPNADELLAKAELARAIERVLRARRLTQAQAARILGVSQPDVSDLYRGRISGYSQERLCRFLKALDQDVQIVVQPKPRSRTRAVMRALVRDKAQPRASR
jgi:predicted XRE-type DNA-binding protein